MLGVLSAERAVLLKLKFFARIFLVLHGIVVSLLAFLASESNFDSCVCSHSYGTSCIILLFGFPASPGSHKKTPDTGENRMPGERNTDTFCACESVCGFA
jgi:hypothetical protein